MTDIFDNTGFGLKDIRDYSPATLAYIGDSVYELYIRTRVLKGAGDSPHKLHMEAVRYVSAKNQAAILDKLAKSLREDEQNIVRRARNQKTFSMPKNASLEDYKHATALEALIGYLYLKKDSERLSEILSIALGKDGI